MICLWGVNGLKRLLTAPDDNAGRRRPWRRRHPRRDPDRRLHAAPVAAVARVSDYVGQQEWRLRHGGPGDQPAAGCRHRHPVVGHRFLVAFKLVDVVRSARSGRRGARGPGHHLPRRIGLPPLISSSQYDPCGRLAPFFCGGIIPTLVSGIGAATGARVRDFLALFISPERRSLLEANHLGSFDDAGFSRRRGSRS